MWLVEKEENFILLKYLLSSVLKRVISIQINSGAQSDTVSVSYRQDWENSSGKEAESILPTENLHHRASNTFKVMNN